MLFYLVGFRFVIPKVVDNNGLSVDIFCAIWTLRYEVDVLCIGSCIVGVFILTLIGHRSSFSCTFIIYCF